MALLLSAVAVVEGTLQLLIAVIGIVAVLLLVAFVVGALLGVFIAYYLLARENS